MLIYRSDRRRQQTPLEENSLESSLQNTKVGCAGVGVKRGISVTYHSYKDVRKGCVINYAGGGSK